MIHQGHSKVPPDTNKKGGAEESTAELWGWNIQDSRGHWDTSSMTGRCSESPAWARRTAGSRPACIMQRTRGRPKLCYMAWLNEEMNNNVNLHNGKHCKLRGESVILSRLCSAVRILNTKYLREWRCSSLCVLSTHIVMVYHRHAGKYWVRPECLPVSK